MGFLSLLKSKPVVLLDGAMGTELDKRGLMGRGRTNMESPDAVLEIHQSYSRCGCDVLTTNTLTMNPIYIETHNVGVSVEEINRAGVQLADRAAGCAQYILGDMSSTGQLLQPYGMYTETQFCDAFCEQAKVLVEAGVDGFLIETVFDMGPGPFAEGIAECVRAGARIVGGCCGTGPEHIRAVADMIRATNPAGSTPCGRRQ